MFGRRTGRRDVWLDRDSRRRSSLSLGQLLKFYDQLLDVFYKASWVVIAAAWHSLTNPMGVVLAVRSYRIERCPIKPPTVNKELHQRPFALRSAAIMLEFSLIAAR